MLDQQSHLFSAKLLCIFHDLCLHTHIGSSQLSQVGRFLSLLRLSLWTVWSCPVSVAG